MKQILSGVIVACLLSACATSKTVPLTRKMPQDITAPNGEIPFVIAKASGVDVGWASTGAAQPSYMDYPMMVPHVSPAAANVGGVLGQAIATAIMDAAPSARAKRLVAAINEDIDSVALNEALMDKIVAASGSGRDIQLSTGIIQTFDRKTPIANDMLKIDATYTLASDASALLVKASVSYDSDVTAYITPHKFENKTPKSEQTGPLYRNQFSYHSDQLPVPELSDDIRELLKSIITTEHDEDLAALTVDSEKAQNVRKLRQARDKRLKAADNDRLTKDEVGLLLISEWQENDSALLHSTIDAAQDYLAEMIAADLIDVSVPQFERISERAKVKNITDSLDALGSPFWMQEYRVVNTDADGRRNFVITSGYFSGSYVSMPASGFSLYGNARKSVK